MTTITRNVRATKAPVRSNAIRHPVGRNVAWSIEADTLVLRINVGAEEIRRAPPSKSGKVSLIGSSYGFINVDDDVMFTVNVCCK